MSVTQPGAYAVTWEKMFIDTAGQTMEAETHKTLLVTDTHTPAFDTDAFRNPDVDNEVSGTNYTSGGVTVTGTEWTIAAGLMTYDQTDVVYTNVTLTGVMAGIFYFNITPDTADALVLLQDFVTAVGPTAADLTIQHAGAGVATLDHTI